MTNFVWFSSGQYRTKDHHIIGYDLMMDDFRNLHVRPIIDGMWNGKEYTMPIQFIINNTEIFEAVLEKYLGEK